MHDAIGQQLFSSARLKACGMRPWTWLKEGHDITVLVVSKLHKGFLDNRIGFLFAFYVYVLFIFFI